MVRHFCPLYFVRIRCCRGLFHYGKRHDLLWLYSMPGWHWYITCLFPQTGNPVIKSTACLGCHVLSTMPGRSGRWCDTPVSKPSILHHCVFVVFVSYVSYSNIYFGVKCYRSAIEIVPNASKRRSETRTDGCHSKLALLSHIFWSLWNGGLFIAYLDLNFLLHTK